MAESGGLSAGRDPSGHLEMYAPNPQESGSSVSHFSTSLSPDELMEPFFTGTTHDVGLAEALMQDIGWLTILGIEPPIADLAAGDSLILKANGGSQPFAWSIVNDDGNKGTLSAPIGKQTTYTAPAVAPGVQVSIRVDGSAGQVATATINIFASALPPDVTTGSASPIDSSSATLNGIVGPNGTNTSYYFEYGKSASYGSVTPIANAGPGISDVSVNADISSLDPETNYHFRLVATNSFGTSYGQDATFDTLPATPQYTLTVNTRGGGNVTLVPPGGTYDAGTDVALTATGVGDWIFSGWSGALSGLATPKTITMNSNKNVTARFIEVKLNSGIQFSNRMIIDPNNIAETVNRPVDFIYGMIEMTIEVATAGETAVVVVNLPDPAPAGYNWYKYASTDGWILFDRTAISGGIGDGAEFNPARTQLTLYITDNGPYDDDPTPGFIKDPSGLAKAFVSNSSAQISGGGGGGCFIATSAFGSSKQPYVKILREFRNRILLPNPVGKKLVAFYYKCSPPLADVIAKHENLRVIVRIGLMPFVGISWIALEHGPEAILLLILFFGIGAVGLLRAKRILKKI